MKSIVATALALLSVLLLSGPAAGADWPAWAPDQQPVPYCINTSRIPIGNTGEPIMTPEAFVSQVNAALTTWTSVPGAAITVTYTGLCDNDPANHRDGVNAVGWGKLSADAAGLAHAVYPQGTFARTGRSRLFEIDLTVDTRFAQSYDNMDDYLTNALPHVLLHEAGHFLGLPHSDNPCSIMYPTVDESAFAGLCEVDRDALRQLYPAP